MAGVTAVVVILTTLFLVIVTKLFSCSRSRDSNGDVLLNFIPNASSSSPSSSSKSWKYDVFLSFRGEDTRKTFVDHLYSALQQHNIVTYKDDVTLDRGDTISPALLSAIQESHIALIIFSENYADSSWCLDELSHIMKCKEDHDQIVIPIFYHVDPSDVRKQKGQFGKAFAKLLKLSKNKNKVESWKKELVDASNIAGWEPKHVANGHEARCIQEIVGSILDKLSSSDSTVEDENLVGMGIRLQQLKSHLRIGSAGVLMVGIWGLGGAGKTTLATSLYKECSPRFDGCYFLGNIREETQKNGLKGLQEKILSTVFGKKMEVESVILGKDKIKQMLCNRKVLIVLDDVDHLDQLQALAGSRKWFGEGSRIIITTRDQHLLTTVDEIEISPISLLSHEEAVQLFNKRAYNAKKPVEDYEVLSQEVVTYAARLPLALIVLGTFLYDKDKDEWLSTLARLKYHPEMGIVEKLKISYDGLKDVEKELFLDIACFYRQESKDKAMKILDACGFYPAIGVKVLIQKALITVSEDRRFDMHDLVEEMAHYIVRGEHPNNPEKHSRVWRKKDIEDMCSGNATMVNEKIEALKYDDGMKYGRMEYDDDYEYSDYAYPDDDGCSFNFIMLVSNMNKLRFLKVSTLFMKEGPSFLSNELRYIDWTGYPASPFPESFQPRKLVILKIYGSLQKELWKGYKYLPCLKEMELSHMKALVRTPDFDGLPCLQKLTLKGCKSLKEIHESLGNHNSLVHVRVYKCKKITRFPSIVRMDKLEILEISECEALDEFPKIEAKMDSLVELSLSYVGIEVLPSTIGEHCTNLTSLELIYCQYLKSIEGSFHALKGLQNFILYLCEQFEKFPKEIFNENLDGLGLRKLDLSSCGFKDGEIPKVVGELSSLRELNLSWNDFTRLDFSLSRLTSLKLLKLNNCWHLVELPELPSSLAVLRADWCESLEDIPINCKCLCYVSVLSYGRSNPIGLERLLETMLQGMGVEGGCMILGLNLGSEIPMLFEPCMVRRGISRMELPENWYNEFSGFLYYGTADPSSFNLDPSISMKHVRKPMGYSQDDDDDDDDDLSEDETGYKTWVTYLPFSLLGDTSWWDPTSTALEVKFEIKYSKYMKFGWKLVPKGRAASDAECSSETTPTTHSFSDNNDDYTYKCELEILHDSKSHFKFQIHEQRWWW